MRHTTKYIIYSLFSSVQSITSCVFALHTIVYGFFFCFYLFSSIKFGYMSYFAIVTKTNKNISLNFWSNTKIRLILLLSTDYTQLNFSLNLQRFSSLCSFVLLCSYVLCNVIHLVSLVYYLGRFFFVKKTVETIFGTLVLYNIFVIQ